MASKRRKTGTRPSSPSSASSSKRRASAQRQAARKRAQRRRYLLLGGAVVLAVAAVAGLALLSGGNGTGSEQPSQDKSLGAADAPVVVVEYADFQCPFCERFATGPEQQLKTEYVDTGQVRFVYRHFAFIGDESFWAAEAAECANAQGRFWEYHDKVFAEQGAENSGAFSKENLKRFAAELELDTAAFNDCVDSNEHRSKVRQETAEAQRRGLNSTPSILVDGKLVANGADYAVLKAAIEAALAQ